MQRSTAIYQGWRGTQCTGKSNGDGSNYWWGLIHFARWMRVTLICLGRLIFNLNCICWKTGMDNIYGHSSQNTGHRRFRVMCNTMKSSVATYALTLSLAVFSPRFGRQLGIFNFAGNLSNGGNRKALDRWSSMRSYCEEGLNIWTSVTSRCLDGMVFCSSNRFIGIIYALFRSFIWYCRR